MSQQISEARLAEIATVSDAPVRTRTNRTFELPGGLYLGTALGYLTFLGIMCTVVFNPELAIPMFAFAFSIIAGFGLCWKWASMRPDNDSKPLSWGQFANRGQVERIEGLGLTARMRTGSGDALFTHDPHGAVESGYSA